jgi:PAS domain S-box-containing protein
MRDVTERQQAEATLRESEERFRGLIENLDIGVVLQNAADRILLSNPAAARVLGLTQDQLHGVTSRDPRWKLVRADGSDLPVEEVPSVVAVRTGRPVHNSLLGTTNLQTGGRIWLQVSANPRLAADGAVAHVLVTLVDVTERVRAENALRESEAKFRAIIEASPVPFALNDEGQNIIYLNTAFIKTFGYDRNDIPTLADWWPKAYPDPDYQQWVATTWKAHLERARAAGTPFEPVELNIRCKDGSQRTVLAGAAPLGETFKGVHLVVLHDITERKQAENALRESEERLREATKAANVGLWEWDLRTNLVWYSPEWKRQIGYEVSEISNRFDEWQSRVHPEDLKAALEEVKRLVENPSRSYDTEFRFRHKDGTYRWILAQASVVVGADGMPVRMIGSHLDITARKQAEEERRKLEAQIRHAQKLESLGVLAGGIAHDFNNLLTGILGYADLALMELPAHSSARPLIDEAVNGARKAADLTKQMLAYSGKGRFVVESLNLNDVVEDMAQLLQVSISKKCVLKLHLMPDLACIEADAVQLRQIIMNLIINASDAIGDQSGVIAVTSGVMYCDRSYLSETYLDENLNEGLYVYLEVADTGCGMSAETRARIFDPFFTTKMTGRGLGLAAVLGIVRGHRGAMKIYSELGKGTTFKVAFPAVDLPAHSQPTSGSTDATWRGSGIVLVVDDEEAVRGLARRMLELMGFTVLTARDGREAVEVFRRESDRIRLVLLDMTMPHLDGAETFREMRRIRSDVKAILTSGYNEQSAISQFAGKGLAGFIQKPYRYEELLAVIRSALGS